MNKKILSIVLYIMGADTEVYKKIFGMEVPKDLECDDKATYLRSLFRIRNAIIFSKKNEKDDRRYISKLLTREEYDDIYNKFCEVLTENTEYVILNNVNIQIRRTLVSYLDSNSLLASHTEQLFNFMVMRDNTNTDLLTLQNKLNAGDVKYMCGIYFDGVNKLKGEPRDNCFVIFKDDYNFLSKVYEMSNEEWEDITYIKQGSDEKMKLFSEIEKKQEISVIADCDNINTVYLTLLLRDLVKMDNIHKITVVTVNNSPFNWYSLSENKISVVKSKRILKNKNSTDMVVASQIMQSHYRDGCNDVIIVSGDSDYHTVMSVLDNCKFTIIECDTMSEKYKKTLASKNIDVYSLRDMYDINSVLNIFGGNDKFLSSAMAVELIEKQGN